MSFQKMKWAPPSTTTPHPIAIHMMVDIHYPLDYPDDQHHDKAFFFEYSHKSASLPLNRFR